MSLLPFGYLYEANYIQIRTGRLSYINIVLITFCGVPIRGEVYKYLILGRSFGGSVRLPGYFGGTCTNYK